MYKHSHNFFFQSGITGLPQGFFHLFHFKTIHNDPRTPYILSIFFKLKRAIITQRDFVLVKNYVSKLVTESLRFQSRCPLS